MWILLPGPLVYALAVIPLATERGVRGFINDRWQDGSVSEDTL
jgi:hypothetical protein